jgi:hypothetical protein
MAARARKRDTCRNRPTKCDGCGYRAYTTRAWLQRGLLTCPCGGELRPTKPEDLAFIGLVGPEDMSQAQWNEIARAEGWAIVRNQGQASRKLSEPILGDAPVRAHCAFPGCGLWVKSGAGHCTAGHSQTDDGPEAADLIPF